MTYKEARVYLDKVSKYGSVLGLDTIQNLLNELGNPQDQLKFIHIVGTNGKGSTLSFISSILQEAGYRTGRYTSPAVLTYLEMIQVDGEMISEVDFARLVEKVKNAIARMETKGLNSPTIFEVETAIAFLYFYEKDCDYVVLETGLGGIEDATNVVKNTVAAVFATISCDHMGILGNDIKEIAEKKAGIIKSGCKVISASQEPEVQCVLQKYAERVGCSITFAQPEKAVIKKSDHRGSRFSYKDQTEWEIKLAGSYQIINAVTAIEFAQSGVVPGISVEAIREGLKKTEWVGRFTCVSEEPLFIIDGAHNEDAAKRLRETVELYFPEKKKIFICGVFKDKEYDKIAKLMAPLADKIYTINLPNQERTFDAECLKAVMKSYCTEDCIVEAVGMEYGVESQIEMAIEKSLEEADENTVILAFGSLSYLGRIVKYMRESL